MSEAKRETTDDGAFMPDGSWVHGGAQGAAHHAVLELARRVSREHVPPGFAAELVRACPHRIEREDCLAVWEWVGRRTEPFSLWPCCHTSTSAGEFIKRAACREVFRA